MSGCLKGKWELVVEFRPKSHLKINNIIRFALMLEPTTSITKTKKKRNSSKQIFQKT